MTKKEIIVSMTSFIVVCTAILFYQHIHNIQTSYKTPKLALNNYSNPIPKAIDIIDIHEFNDDKNAVIFYNGQINNGKENETTGKAAIVKRFRYGWKVIDTVDFGFANSANQNDGVYNGIKAGTHNLLFGTVYNDIKKVTYDHQKAVLLPIKSSSLKLWVFYDLNKKGNIKPTFETD